MRPKRHVDQRCEAITENPKHAVLCSVVKGHATVRCLEVLMQSFEEVAAEAPGVRLEVFHDWQQVDSYASGSLEKYTEWSKRHRDQVKLIHVLVASRMVAMAISVARLVLPYLIGYSSRQEFEKARRSCVGPGIVLRVESKLRDGGGNAA
jgi:hypothetical protein